MAFFSTTTSWLRLAFATHIPFEERIDFFERLFGFEQFSRAIGFIDSELASDPKLPQTLTSVFLGWMKHRDFERAYALAFERTNQHKLAEHIAQFASK